MFDNIGEALKKISVFFFWLSLIITICIAVILFVKMQALTAILVLLSIVFSWIAWAFVYGFGEIILKVTAIEKNTRPKRLRATATVEHDDKKSYGELDEMLEMGLITEKEYRREISKL